MKALLLLNLGTPQAPFKKEVKSYLAEFLMDPLVIDIPWLARFLLIYGIILNTRPGKSSAAYRKIWSETRGSPLLYHSQDLREKVQALLYPQYHVELAMRYGEPSVRSALQKIKELKCDEIIVLPLYPQYSLAASASSIEKCREEAAKLGISHLLRERASFYADEGFISSFVERVRETQTRAGGPSGWDHILFSYHGIPERHVKKTDPSGGQHCLASPGCCDTISDKNARCYRAQCYATTRSLAQALRLQPQRHSVSFQSRLGRTPWIQPFTDLVLEELARKGVRRLIVACPAFVADCLETLEEIEIRAREDFKKFGGEELWLVHSLNSSDTWAQAVVELARDSHGLHAKRAQAENSN